MKAFRKRLRLTRLDDEYGLGYGPMSSGQQSNIVAITPPNHFFKAVWQELIKQGKLKQEPGRLLLARRTLTDLRNAINVAPRLTPRRVAAFFESTTRYYRHGKSVVQRGQCPTSCGIRSHLLAARRNGAICKRGDLESDCKQARGSPERYTGRVRTPALLLFCSIKKDDVYGTDSQ